MRYVISGGGTGGHIFPAIAIADALKRRMPDTEILFIGAEGRMEMERVPKAGYKIEGLWISGLTKDLSVITLPFKLISSLRKAKKLLKSFHPDAVIGVGGFASGPTLKAANWLGIPTVIQEQNSYPGKTNRNVGQKAKAICVAYHGLDRWFPNEKIHFTGNPLRGNINGHCDREESAAHFGLDPNRPVVLLVGGSQGALGINKGISAQIEKFKGSETQLIWQTGKYYYDQAVKEVKENNLEDLVKPTVFIERMDYAYSVADVVISRAGAISISELALVQKPVIFVPLPTAAEDHQTKNALALADRGAAVLVRDADCGSQGLLAVKEIFDSPQRAAQMSAAIAQMGVRGSADKIVDQIETLLV